MVPVGARLLQRESVDERFARRNAVEADARHAIHFIRQHDAVPVDRGRHLQPIGDAQGERAALLASKNRTRHTAVDGNRQAGATGDIDRRIGNIQRKIAAAEHGRLARAGQRPGAGGTQQAQAGGRAAQRKALHKATTRKIRRSRGKKVFHDALRAGIHDDADRTFRVRMRACTRETGLS